MDYKLEESIMSSMAYSIGAQALRNVASQIINRTSSFIVKHPVSAAVLAVAADQILLKGAGRNAIIALIQKRVPDLVDTEAEKIADTIQALKLDPVATVDSVVDHVNNSDPLSFNSNDVKKLGMK